MLDFCFSSQSPAGEQAK